MKGDEGRCKGDEVHLLVQYERVDAGGRIEREDLPEELACMHINNRETQGGGGRWREVEGDGGRWREMKGDEGSARGSSPACT